MPDDHDYYVVTRVADLKGGDPYHATQALALDLARKNPGLTFEVLQYKVWLTVTSKEG